jgi:hypothetical protein
MYKYNKLLSLFIEEFMEYKVSLYTYMLPVNETLYKGMDIQKMDMEYNKPIWFSLKEYTANQYGQYLHKVLTKRSLKLINITSPYFQSTFMDFLNDYYRDEIQAYNKKMVLLSPIGLPDEESQTLYLKDRGFNPVNIQCKKDICRDVAFFYNHHRFSEMSMDANFVLFLKQIHKQYNFDGYIAPCIWPSKYHIKFSDEICLFDLKETNALNYVNVIKNESILQTGGRLRLVPKISPKYVEKNTWETLEMLKESGWKGEYEISSDGFLISPSSYELGEFCRNKIAEQKEKELKEIKQQIRGGKNKK